ncbi:MAG: AmmeMemoRadiSam system protein B [Spirochaetota bacterium]
MTRTRTLQGGWYPDSAHGVRRQCESWEAGLGPAVRRFRSVVVPHAGWVFSGRIAYETLRRLQPDLETIVVVGGHLRPDDPLHLAPEDRYETPLGELEADDELADLLSSTFAAVPDRRPDNTVEVQLPLVHYLYPGARALYLRCPPSETALATGRAVAEFAARSGRRIGVVGSTDLTHYGPAYDFAPRGLGEEAVRWVRRENDRAIVDAMLALDAETTIRRALDDRSACSSGAAAASITYALRTGCEASELVEYGQSYDVRPDASFVGYAGIGFYS